MFSPPTGAYSRIFSIFRNLQDFHSFAPLRIQNFDKNLPFFLRIFTGISQNFAKISFNFDQILVNFNEISPEFYQNFTKISQNLQRFCRSENPTTDAVKRVTQSMKPHKGRRRLRDKLALNDKRWKMRSEWRVFDAWGGRCGGCSMRRAVHNWAILTFWARAYHEGVARLCVAPLVV